MPPRTYRHAFVDAISVFIPGSWHTLQTARLLCTVFVLAPYVGKLTTYDLRIHPDTYDVALDFCTWTSAPETAEGVVATWSEPLTGEVLLIAWT